MAGLTTSFTGLYVGTDDGLYRSYDCGESWETLGWSARDDDRVRIKSPMPMTALSIRTDGTIYSGGHCMPFASSADSGMTWTLGEPVVLAQSLAASDADATIIAARNRCATQGPPGLARSDDGGRNWTSIGATDHGCCLARLRNRIDVIYLAGGSEWILAMSNATHDQFGAVIVTQQWELDSRVTALTSESKNGVMWAGSASGSIYRSSDEGTTWQPVFQSPDSQPIRSIAQDVAQPEMLYVVTGDDAGGAGRLWLIEADSH